MLSASLVALSLLAAPPESVIDLDASALEGALASNSAFPEFTGRGPSTPLFVKFFAPWCGHCKSLAPTWTELAGQDLGGARVARVDCTAETTVCKQYGVRGYPFLLYFARDGRSYRYKGKRALRALADFARGGWASSAPFDPTALPPSKRNASLISDMPNVATALGVCAGTLTVAAMIAVCWDMLRHDRVSRDRVADVRPAARNDRDPKAD